MGWNDFVWFKVFVVVNDCCVCVGEVELWVIGVEIGAAARAAYATSG